MEPHPCSPFCIRSPSTSPWRIDTPSHTRAWEAEKTRQAQFNQRNPCPKTAKGALYWPRIIIAGDIAGAWGKFGGLSAQLGFLGNHLEAFVGRSAGVMTRLAEEELTILAHEARSRADPGDILQSLEESDRELRPRVIDDQLRAPHFRHAQSGNRKYKGSYRGSSSNPGSTKDSKKEQGASSDRNPKKRARGSGTQTGSDRKVNPQESKFEGHPHFTHRKMQRWAPQARFSVSVPSPPLRNFGPDCADRFRSLTFLSGCWVFLESLSKKPSFCRFG